MGKELIDQYIICRNNCPLRYIEALAMNGFIREVSVKDCEKPRYQKLQARLINDALVTSECRFDEEIRQSMKIIGVYLQISRKNRSEERIDILSKHPIDQ